MIHAAARWLVLLLLPAVLSSPSSMTAAPQAPPPAQSPAGDPAFAAWLAGVRAEALSRGISANTLDLAFADLQPIPSVIERDRAQAELTLSLDQYLKRRLTSALVKTASREASLHGTLLGQVSAKYGVPSSIIVAIWGLESNFGRLDRKSTRLNSSHSRASRMPSSA